MSIAMDMGGKVYSIMGRRVVVEGGGVWILDTSLTTQRGIVTFWLPMELVKALASLPEVAE